MVGAGRFHWKKGQRKNLFGLNAGSWYSAVDSERSGRYGMVAVRSVRSWGIIHPSKPSVLSTYWPYFAWYRLGCCLVQEGVYRGGA